MFSKQEIEGNITSIQLQIEYNIWQELKSIRTLMDNNNNGTNVEEILTNKEPTKKLKCNKCGKEFTDKGSLLAHYRKHKKEGK